MFSSKPTPPSNKQSPMYNMHFREQQQPNNTKILNLLKNLENLLKKLQQLGIVLMNLIKENIKELFKKNFF